MNELSVQGLKDMDATVQRLWLSRAAAHNMHPYSVLPNYVEKKRFIPN